MKPNRMDSFPVPSALAGGGLLTAAHRRSSIRVFRFRCESWDFPWAVLVGNEGKRQGNRTLILGKSGEEVE